MQTPEEFAAQIGSALWNGDDAADLIRARDAEVAAYVLAEVRRANTTAVPSRAFVSRWDAEP